MNISLRAQKLVMVFSPALDPDRAPDPLDTPSKDHGQDQDQEQEFARVFIPAQKVTLA